MGKKGWPYFGKPIKPKSKAELVKYVMTQCVMAANEEEFIYIPSVIFTFNQDFSPCEELDWIMFSANDFIDYGAEVAELLRAKAYYVYSMRETYSAEEDDGLVRGSDGKILAAGIQPNRKDSLSAYLESKHEKPFVVIAELQITKNYRSIIKIISESEVEITPREKSIDETDPKAH